MKIYVTHASSFDYQTELYEPLRSSLLRQAHEIFLPHEQAVEGVDTKDIISHSDVCIAEVSYPSTGQGIELAYAHMHNVPTLCLYKKGSRPSSSLRFLGVTVQEYEHFNDFIGIVEQFILQQNI